MTKEFTIHSHYHISDNAICQQLDAEALVMNALTGETFGLDAMSALFWQLMETESTLVAVVNLVAPLLNVESAQLERDLMQFAKQLQARGFLEF